MAAGTLSSRVLGLLRETLLTAYFNRTVTDAWTVAFRLPNIFRRLLGEGSLSVSFIPVFVDCLYGQKNEVKAKNLVNSLYTLLLLILSCLTILGIVFSKEILMVLLDQPQIPFALHPLPVVTSPLQTLTLVPPALLFGFKATGLMVLPTIPSRTVL